MTDEINFLETKEEWKNLKFMKETFVNMVEKEDPRFNMKIPS